MLPPAEACKLDPKHWLACADEIRAFADGMKDGYAREIMLRIANDYLKLAEYTRLERAAKNPPPTSASKSS